VPEDNSWMYRCHPLVLDNRGRNRVRALAAQVRAETFAESSAASAQFLSADIDPQIVVQ
jgi:hypothetical protein